MGTCSTYDLCINQGATFTQEFLLTSVPCSGAIGATTAPVDLTGYTANLQIRPYTGSPTLYYDASSDIVLGGVAGTIVLTILSADTSTFTWFNAVYSLLLTDPTGVITEILSGNVIVQPWVTQVVGPTYGFLVEDGTGFLLAESSAYFEQEAGP